MVEQRAGLCLPSATLSRPGDAGRAPAHSSQRHLPLNGQACVFQKLPSGHLAAPLLDSLGCVPLLGLTQTGGWASQPQGCCQAPTYSGLCRNPCREAQHNWGRSQVPVSLRRICGAHVDRSLMGRELRYLPGGSCQSPVVHKHQIGHLQRVICSVKQRPTTILTQQEFFSDAGGSHLCCSSSSPHLQVFGVA